MMIFLLPAEGLRPQVPGNEFYITRIFSYSHPFFHKENNAKLSGLNIWVSYLILRLLISLPYIFISFPQFFLLESLLILTALFPALFPLRLLQQLPPNQIYLSNFHNVSPEKCCVP